MPSSYPLGNTIRLTAHFAYPDTGVAFDPDTVTIRVRNPNFEVTKPVALRDSQGYYHCDVVGDVAGVWYWRVDSTNPVSGGERSFTVVESKFPNAP